MSVCVCWYMSECVEALLHTVIKKQKKQKKNAENFFSMKSCDIYPNLRALVISLF